MVELTFFCTVIFFFFFAREVVIRSIFRNRCIKDSVEYTKKHIHKNSVFKEVHTIVEDLARRAGIPTPALHIVESTQQPVSVGVVQTGKNSSAIIFSDGVIEQLTHDELEGAIAHEIGHISNRRYFFIREFIMLFSGASLYSGIVVYAAVYL